MPQQVIVTVDESGEVRVEAKGVVGSGCSALTKAIEQAIGTTTGDAKKPEFHQQTPNTQKAVQ